MKVAAVLIVALTFVSATSAYSQPPALEAVGYAVTGEHFQVFCQTVKDQDAFAQEWGNQPRGTTFVDIGRIELAPDVCTAFRFPRQVAKWSDAYVYALVFAHELGHALLRTYDETRAECYGLAHYVQVGRLLGMPPPTRAQKVAVLRAHAQLPAKYRGSC